MSLNELTKPATKLEQWSTLYCYALNATFATIDKLPGSVSTLTEVIAVDDFTFTSGSGTVTLPQSIQNVWTSNTDNRDEVFTTVSGSIFITAPTAPFNAVSGNSRMIMTLELPIEIMYPANFGNIIPGTISGSCANGVNGNSAVSGQIIRSNTSEVTFDICIAADISVAAQSMSLGFSFTYQAVP